MTAREVAQAGRLVRVVGKCCPFEPQAAYDMTGMTGAIEHELRSAFVLIRLTSWPGHPVWFPRSSVVDWWEWERRNERMAA